MVYEDIEASREDDFGDIFDVTRNEDNVFEFVLCEVSAYLAYFIVVSPLGDSGFLLSDLLRFS